MLERLIRIVLFSALVCLCGPRIACADIYTWVDAQGRVNISNLTPPEGVSVTNVVHETPLPSGASVDTARQAAQQAELQALSQRVRQLEAELQYAAQRPAPPPQVQYPVVQAPPVVQYIVEAPVAASPPCGDGWSGCGSWWDSGLFPVGVFLVAPNFYRPPYHHGWYRGHNPRPMMKSAALQKR